jgi:[DsrC]-trisulfide reductase subunit M
MSLVVAFIAVIVLFAVGFFLGQIEGLQIVLGMFLPLLALVVFIGGFGYRMYLWAKIPVPWRIPTTGGQAKSLSFIKANELDSPSGPLTTAARVLLEVFAFRSLARNTTAELRQTDSGEKVVYHSNLWLWGFSLAFHWAFLFIIIRHLRFFTDPVFPLASLTEFFDSIMQIGVPAWYITDFLILGGLSFLFLRRLVSPQLRYISLPGDWFPLLLLLAIAITGGMMRYCPACRVDVEAVKLLGLGLTSFSFSMPEAQIGPWFYGHLFLVTTLLVYFPASKLMHMGGVFLSPTRNLANNNRAVRHEPPFEIPCHPHTYAEYEDEFRERMVKIGLPVDKPLEEKPADGDKAE